jgi:hypothetical protein
MICSTCKEGSCNALFGISQLIIEIIGQGISSAIQMPFVVATSQNYQYLYVYSHVPTQN